MGYGSQGSCRNALFAQRQKEGKRIEKKKKRTRKTQAKAGYAYQSDGKTEASIVLTHFHTVREETTKSGPYLRQLKRSKGLISKVVMTCPAYTALLTLNLYILNGNSLEQFSPKQPRMLTIPSQDQVSATACTALSFSVLFFSPHPNL